MVELSVVARRHGLEPVSNLVSIEVHQKAHQSQIVRWNPLLELPVVNIAERGVVRWLKPLVNAVHAHQSLELVSRVTLIQKLCEGIGSNFRVINAHLSYLNELFGLRQLVTETVVHLAVLLLIEVDLMLK